MFSELIADYYSTSVNVLKPAAKSEILFRDEMCFSGEHSVA
jgi:hypothetical protein